MQKLKCVLKLGFNKNELIPRNEKVRHSMRSKQNGALEFTGRPGYSLYLHRKGKGINV